MDTNNRGGGAGVMDDDYEDQKGSGEQLSFGDDGRASELAGYIDEEPYDYQTEKAKDDLGGISEGDIEGLIQGVFQESREELAYRSLVNKVAKLLEISRKELSIEEYKDLVDVKYEIAKADNVLRERGEEMEKDGIRLGGEKGAELRAKGREYYTEAMGRIEVDLSSLGINQKELLASLNDVVAEKRKKIEAENKIAREKAEKSVPKADSVAEAEKPGLFKRLFKK